MAANQGDIRYLTPPDSRSEKKKALPIQKERYQVHRLQRS